MDKFHNGLILGMHHKKNKFIDVHAMKIRKGFNHKENAHLCACNEDVLKFNGKSMAKDRGSIFD